MEHFEYRTAGSTTRTKIRKALPSLREKSLLHPSQVPRSRHQTKQASVSADGSSKIELGSSRKQLSTSMISSAPAEESPVILEKVGPAEEADLLQTEKHADATPSSIKQIQPTPPSGKLPPSLHQSTLYEFLHSKGSHRQERPSTSVDKGPSFSKSPFTTGPVTSSQKTQSSDSQSHRKFKESLEGSTRKSKGSKRKDVTEHFHQLPSQKIPSVPRQLSPRNASTVEYIPPPEHGELDDTSESSSSDDEPEKDKRPIEKAYEVQQVKSKKARQRDPSLAIRMPPRVTWSHFRHFARISVQKEMLPFVESCSDNFFKQLVEDLSTYARHAKRQKIEAEDVVLLFHRIRLIKDTQNLESLAEKYLPLEILEDIIPITRAGNVITPP